MSEKFDAIDVGGNGVRGKVRIFGENLDTNEMSDELAGTLLDSTGRIITKFGTDTDSRLTISGAGLGSPIIQLQGTYHPPLAFPGRHTMDISTHGIHAKYPDGSTKFNLWQLGLNFGTAVYGSNTLRMGNTTRIEGGNIKLSGTAGGDISLYRPGVDVTAENLIAKPGVSLDGAGGSIIVRGSPVPPVLEYNIELFIDSNNYDPRIQCRRVIQVPQPAPSPILESTTSITPTGLSILRNTTKEAEITKDGLSIGNTTRIEGGNIRLSGTAGGDILLYEPGVNVTNPDKEPTIAIDGEHGDIILRNADLAEEFDISEIEDVEPGDVLILDGDDDTLLRRSVIKYDRRAIGVVSGAGNYKPGIVLDKSNRRSKNRVPVAILGKVYCKVDAEYSSIERGDLLTTSDTRGHAMKALDSTESFGAIIGKALKLLERGKSLIPILVMLK